MKRKKKTVLILAAAALILAGCKASAQPVESQPGEDRLLLTQEKTVRGESFRENPKYRDFLEIASKGTYIPGLDQHLIPQGISFSENTGLVYLSAYSPSPGVSSVIAALDGKTGLLQAEYRLFQQDGSPFTGHVGGIAAAGNSLYLSAGKDEVGQYRIARMDLTDLPASGSSKLVLDTFLTVHTVPSFLSSCGEYLLVGNFYHTNGKYPLPDTVEATVKTRDGEQGCFILGYQLTGQGGPVQENGEIEPEFALSAPDRIQGICCRENRIYLSQSYGRKNDSAILMYDPEKLPQAQRVTIGEGELPLYVLDSRSLSGQLTAMPMTEGLCRGPGEELLLVFESGAKKYADGRDRTDSLWHLDLP